MRAKKEARHATHVKRVTVPRDQRARLSSWPFHQLGEFIAYKARRVGVPFVEVDPAYTSLGGRPRRRGQRA
ncbi:IS200/IS605 family accessory protein TnpB-related protein [Streptomyces canus]|uniref:IS200/IS605 family accessory protein TnpB-related protein n=1 Tax=Streptomyces canus TaxID=58343 RepID=UPI00338EACD4